MQPAVYSGSSLEYFESDWTELQNASNKLTIDSVRYLHVFFDVVIKFGQKLHRVKPKKDWVDHRPLIKRVLLINV